MAWNDAVITNIGMNMLVQAAGGTALNICTAKCGGTAVDVAALILQTDVSDPKKIIQITGFEINGNKIKVSVRIINSGITSTYTVRQIGLYAKQTGSETEKLLAIIQDNTGELIPTETENPNFQIDFAFSIVISNTDNITVTVNPEAYITVEEFKSHAENKNNPHGVTKSQIGLGNVPNVMTNDQTPTYTIESENKDLSSGEKLSIAFGKIAKAISSFFKHIADNVSHITSSEREIWNNSQEKLYITGSGNPVVIDNLQGGVPFPEIVVIGKNMIPYPYHTPNIHTTNGITFTVNDDKSITANGTATAQADYYLKTNLPIRKGRYTLSGCPEGGMIDNKVYYTIQAFGDTLYVSGNGILDTGSGAEIDAAEDFVIKRIMIRIAKDTVCDNVIFRPQLETGDAATAYEPPITGRELTIHACGKNLINFPYSSSEKTENGITFTSAADGSITVNGTAEKNASFTVDDFRLYPAGNYVLSPNGTNNANVVIIAYKRGFVPVVANVNGGAFTLTEPTELRITISVWAGKTAENAVIYPQLEIGNTPTEYAPYSGAEHTITPDSNPCTVPDDIRQQDGLNVLTVSAGELTVIGNTINPQLKKTVDMIDDNATKLYSLDSSGNPYIGEDKENNKVYVQWDGVKYLKLSSRFNKTAADYAASAGIVGVVSYPSSGTTGDVVLGFKPSCVIAVSQSFTNSTAGQKTFAVMITGSIAQTLYHPDGSVIISLTDTGFSANFNSGKVSMFRYIAFK